MITAAARSSVGTGVDGQQPAVGGHSLDACRDALGVSAKVLVGSGAAGAVRKRSRSSLVKSAGS